MVQSKFPKCCILTVHQPSFVSPQQGDNITARRHKTRNRWHLVAGSADRSFHVRIAGRPSPLLPDAFYQGKANDYVGMRRADRRALDLGLGLKLRSKLGDSRDAAMLTKYRISLRASS